MSLPKFLFVGIVLLFLIIPLNLKAGQFTIYSSDGVRVVGSPDEPSDSSNSKSERDTWTRVYAPGERERENQRALEQKIREAKQEAAERRANEEYQLKNKELEVREKELKAKNKRTRNHFDSDNNDNNDNNINRSSGSRGATDVTSGQYFPPVAGGVIDPRDGTFHQDVGGGYVNTKTGSFSPKIGQ